MIDFQVLGLALIQGLTEFLPVSSSGHLILFSYLTSYEDQGQLMDIALHIGSLFAVMIYFWQTIKEILIELIQSKGRADFSKSGVRLAYNILLATLPAIFIGGCLRYFGMSWTRNIELIGWMLIIYSVLLWYADNYYSTEKEIKDIKMRDAIFIGLAQCLAFIPGTSRSGVTITVGRFLGYNRSEIAKFSMLLSLPVIFGAGVLAFREVLQAGEYQQFILTNQAIVFSFIFSYMAIYLMMKWLRYATYLPFVIYRIVLGSVLLLKTYGIM